LASILSGGKISPYEHSIIRPLAYQITDVIPPPIDLQRFTIWDIGISVQKNEELALRLEHGFCCGGPPD